MREPLEIRTLGGLRIQHGERSVSGRTAALLAYLVCTRRAQAREVLATFLWPESPQAPSNLRTLLTTLRRDVGSYVLTGDPVAMAPEQGWWLDVAEFEHQLDTAPQDDVRALEAALALYQGDFLAGVYVDSQSFEDWARLERERLRLRAMQALDTLITCHLAQGEYARGLARATQLLGMDNLREKTHRQLMELLAQSGEREAALAQYDTCRRLLDEELGTKPTPQTVALFERIVAGESLPHPSKRDRLVGEALPRPSTHNLPVQATSFVGREADIKAIRQELAGPDCRLLTLAGPAGIGKTRLAAEIARRISAQYRHGVFWIDLAPLRQPDEILLALAAALNLAVQTGNHTFAQIVHWLRDRKVLLVFDNFEHLLGGVELLDRLLDQCEGVTAMVTSREVLRMQREWVWMVEGLSYPGPDSIVSMDTFDAVQLFVARAAQVNARIDLAAAGTDVVNVVRLVEGVPLGIELAASWLRVLTCEEIAGEMERSLEFLQTQSRDVQPRHRSIRAVLDHSFDLLDAGEQQVFQRLAVFRGGFTREAAREVTGTSLTQLSALVDKSLVRMSAEGRYSLHEMVRWYAKERLGADPSDEINTRDRHAAYYADFFAELDPHLRGAHREDFEAAGREIDNTRSAWAWAIEQSRMAVLHKLAGPLTNFHDHRGWHHELWHIIDQAVDVVRQSGDEGALCCILTCRGAAGRMSGRSDEAIAALKEALSIARRIGARQDEAEVLLVLANVYVEWGRLDVGLPVVEECLAIAREIGARMVVANAIDDYFKPFLDGDYDRYYELMLEALRLYREVDCRWGMCHELASLALFCYMVRHEFDRAQQLIEEASEMYERTVAPWVIGILNMVAGALANMQQRNDDARRYALEIFSVAQEPSFSFSFYENSMAALITAMIMADEGELRRAAEMASVTGWIPQLLIQRFLAQPLIARLRDRLEPAEFDAAWARGWQRGIADVAREAVAWLEAGLDDRARI
jgi:predicted ATPase/DNA-binding SARP family transcriptional activator